MHHFFWDTLYTLWIVINEQPQKVFIAGTPPPRAPPAWAGRGVAEAPATWGPGQGATQISDYFAVYTNSSIPRIPRRGRGGSRPVSGSSLGVASRGQSPVPPVIRLTSEWEQNHFPRLIPRHLHIYIWIKRKNIDVHINCIYSTLIYECLFEYKSNNMEIKMDGKP